CYRWRQRRRRRRGRRLRHVRVEVRRRAFVLGLEPSAPTRVAAADAEGGGDRVRHRIPAGADAGARDAAGVVRDAELRTNLRHRRRRPPRLLPWWREHRRWRTEEAAVGGG